jgi:hypothetical protein
MIARPNSDAPSLGWLIRVLLACYPRAWRERYDGEVRALLGELRDSGTSRLSLVLDLGLGVADAWLRPVGFEQEDAGRDATNRFIATTGWGLLLFVFAGAGFAKMTEYPEFVAAAHRHVVVGLCFDVLLASAVAAGAVMALATLPAVVALLRWDRGRSRTTLLCLGVAPLSVGAVVAAALVARSVAVSNHPHSATNVAAFLGLAGITVLAGVCTTVALTWVATRIPETRSVVVTRRIAMGGLAFCTAAATLAVTGWAVGLAFTDPSLLQEDNGLLSSPAIPTVASIVAQLALAAVLCARSGWNAIRSPLAAPVDQAQLPTRRSAK